MADSQTEIRSRVRTITDYDSNIINNADMDDVVNTAEDEIRSDLGDPSLVFYQGTDTFNLDLAVFWLSALFAKIKAGELDGPDMSVGDLETRPLDAQSSIWFSRYRKAIQRTSAGPGFGRTTVQRDDRTYGESF